MGHESAVLDALAQICRHVDLNDRRYAQEIAGGRAGWRVWGLDWALSCARTHPDRFAFVADGRLVLARWAGCLLGHLDALRRGAHPRQRPATA